MSDTQLKKNTKLGKNFIALLQLTLAGISLILIALSLKSFCPRFDLTTQNEFSLSDYSVKLLKSELLQVNPIQITCLADQQSPYFNRVQNILQEYERLSKKGISLTFCDPLRNPSEAFKIIGKYKLKPTEDLLILDTGGAEVRTAIIPFSDLTVFEVSQQKQRKLSTFQTEDVVSSTLLSLVEGKQRKVYLITSNTDANNVHAGSIGETLQNLYRNQNINLQPLSLSNITAIPDDANGLVFLTPQYDLEPNELSVLVDYWNTPKASLLFILDSLKYPNNLRAFIRSHGVTQRKDRIFLRKNNALASKIIANFTKGFALNDTLQGKSTLFDGISNTLEVREAADDLANKKITPIALIQASPNRYYSESRYLENNAKFNESEDIKNPLYLGAAVIKGNEMSDVTADSSCRMVILSTSDFLKPNLIRNEQVDFMKNAINWLAGRAELAGIGPRPLQRYKLNLIPSETAFVNRLTLFIFPLLFLLIGLFVWNLRRS